MSCPYLSVHDMVYYNNCNLWCNNVQMKSITMCHKLKRARGQVAILFHSRSIFEMNCVHWFILTHRHIIRVCQMSSKSQNGALMVVNPICWAYLLLECFPQIQIFRHFQLSWQCQSSNGYPKKNLEWNSKAEPSAICQYVCQSFLFVQPIKS